MNKFSLRLCTITILILSVTVTAAARDLKSVLKELDKVIADRASYAAAEEERISRLKEQLLHAETPEGRYYFMDRIEEEYRFFNLDSCFAYIEQKKELAHILGNESYICGYNLNYADIYIKSGYFREAQEILDQWEEKIPDSLYGYYLNIMASFYRFQLESAKLPADMEYYERMLEENLQKRLAHFEGEAYHLIYFEELMDKKEYDIVEEYLLEFLPITENPHSRSAIMYSLANLNGQKGKEKERIYWLALTAINDIKTGVREHKALSNLAIALYSNNNIDRAEIYLKAAMDDAALCFARPMYLQSLEFFTSIDKAFNKQLLAKNTSIVIALAIISILALALAIFAILLYKYYRKVSTANLNIQEAYDNLSMVNRQLNDITVIKDKYIGMYMDQCSAYLSKLDNYRKSLRRMLKLGNVDKLQKEISSEDFIKQEVKEFYANFDTAFLNLYPTFPEEFNNLLKDEEQIKLSSPGRLNTELRVYALIRLGIDDSVKIAQFLRYSVQTIYNCRTQMRNKAKGERNMFENQVKKIGAL